MGHTTTLMSLTFLLSQVYSAPQFIDFKDGRIGVNFGGYHAGVGIGGGGAGGGLFAEAGTPFGQAARAGLGGSTADGQSGGLYAGATAGGNVRAEAGLGGSVQGEKSVGAGFASAQAGNKVASAGLGGENSAYGSTGFKFAGTKSFGGSVGVVKGVEPLPDVQPVEIIRPAYKGVRKQFAIESINEVTPVKTAEVEVTAQALPPSPPTVVKEVSRTWESDGLGFRSNYETTFNVFDVRSPIIRRPPDYFVPRFVPPEPVYRERSWWRSQRITDPDEVVYQPVTVEKHIVRSRPRHHHFRKTAYVGGYLGGNNFVAQPAAPELLQPLPVLEKRIDVGVSADRHAVVDSHPQANNAGQVAYTKQVSFQRNPNFFADIFNIPISTLQAVGNFLSNSAANTKVSVQKSASVQAESDVIPSKHSSPSSAWSAGSTDAQVSIQTPTASKFIDDIFAIPINTLGAVNKFLENNVSSRKRVDIITEDVSEPLRVRLGPHARRRANKQVYIAEEEKPAA